MRAVGLHQLPSSVSSWQSWTPHNQKAPRKPKKKKEEKHKEKSSSHRAIPPWLAPSSPLDTLIPRCVAHIIKLGIAVIHRDLDKRSFLWDIDIASSVLSSIFISMLTTNALRAKWVRPTTPAQGLDRGNKGANGCAKQTRLTPTKKRSKQRTINLQIGCSNAGVFLGTPPQCRTPSWAAHEYREASCRCGWPGVGR